MVGWRFDSDDVLCRVDHDWDVFALANGGQRCVPPPLGTPLTGIVSGGELYLLWSAILRVARERSGCPIEVTYRCDAPTIRRTLVTRAISHDGATVRLRSRIVAERERPAVALLDTAIIDRLGEMIRMCSWCAKVKTDRWVDVEEACRDLALLERDKLPPVTHGICDPCVDAMTGDLELSPGLLPGHRRTYTSISSTLRPGASQPHTS